VSLLRRSRSPDHVPEPPAPMPPGRLVHVAGRGEFFVRDSGGDGPPVLLLHGWMFASDLNWWTMYAPLRDAGYRVLAMDHRGHGRGLRTPEDFRLVDCAADAAAVVRELGAGPVVAVGYSMGGPIAQLLARDHRDVVGGLVLCATATDWQDLYLKLFWRTMAGLRLLLGLFPTSYWRRLLALSGMPTSPERTWTAAELSRGSAPDIAEAGRELSRHDARPWIRSLRDLPSAVVVTTRDLSVLPRKQKRLARDLGAPTFGVRDDHFAVTTSPGRFADALLAALAAVGAADREVAA
jgi:pimeloyl-ACP methyl ester carboxylesterase